MARLGYVMVSVPDKEIRDHQIRYGDVVWEVLAIASLSIKGGGL
jgi:hypothetical protein